MISEKIITAFRQLNYEDVPKATEETLEETEKLAQAFFDAKQRESDVKKVLDTKKKGLLKMFDIGDEVTLNNIGLVVKVSARETVDMDEDKLRYLLETAAKTNKLVDNILERETIERVVVNEDVLEKCINEGYIKQEDINSCITVKKSPILSVKKMKTGGKK